MEVGDFYSDLGVTFVNAMIVSQPELGPSLAFSSPNVIIYSGGSFAPQPTDPLEAIFANPVSSATLTAQSVGIAGFLLNGYDANGNLIATAQSFGTGQNGAGSTVHRTLSLTADDIWSIAFSQVLLNPYDGRITFDDLIFTPQSVPEPATLSLLGAGLLGMLAARRRRV